MCKTVRKSAEKIAFRLLLEVEEFVGATLPAGFDGGETGVDDAKKRLLASFRNQRSCGVTSAPKIA